MTGGEVSAALGDVPVIFLTALLKSVTAERNMAGHPVLAKPVKLEVLTAKIEAALVA